MKLMSYNILNGGKERLKLIEKVVAGENPDFLTVNEANAFSGNTNRLLKKFAQDLSFQYFDLALSGEYDYHVAVFSKYPLINVQKIIPLKRACLVSQIETEIGKLSIAGFHLTPYSEDLRHPEIELILDYQKSHQHRILMGDMNSLSKFDNYSADLIASFNEMQLKKFTTDGRLRFDLIDKILADGYQDIGLLSGKNLEFTAPTSINEFSAHSNMRLDYIFISQSLIPNFSAYSVIKTIDSEKASDHYPVTVILNK